MLLELKQDKFLILVQQYHICQILLFEELLPFYIQITVVFHKLSDKNHVIKA